MNHRYSVFKRFLGVFKIDFFSLKINLSAVLAVNPEKTFHQRGFSGAVLTHKGVNRSCFYCEVDLIEGFYARKGFFNIFHSQKNRFFILLPDIINIFFFLTHKIPSPVRYCLFPIGGQPSLRCGCPALM